VALLAAVGLSAGSAQGQGLDRRVAAAPDGEVRLTFGSRQDVCGDGYMIFIGDETITFQGWSSMNTTRGDRRQDIVVDVCGHANAHKVRVVLTVGNHSVRGVRTYVGGEWHAAMGPTTDLGLVSGPAAAQYLVSVAQREDPEGITQAILGAVIADSAAVWPGLLAIAKDQSLPTRTRTASLRWLAAAAGDSAARGLNAMIADPNGDRDVRRQAVYALSRLPRDSSVPMLITIGKTNRDPEIRRAALNYLAQSNDPRAIALFEELLVRR
jgi:hypothetical protein